MSRALLHPARLLFASAVLASVALAQDKVWVVDAGGAGDFTEIADALPLTGEGWTVLVRPGVYTQPVVIANQGLTLVSDGTGDVILTEPLLVSGLAKTRDLILSGLVLDRGFEIRDCQGLVRLQNCMTEATEYDEDIGYSKSYQCHIGPGRHLVTNCRGVTFVGCSFRGADGADAPNVNNPWDGLPGQDALIVSDASVALYSTTLIGGDGGRGDPLDHLSIGGAGGDGLVVEDGGLARVTNPYDLQGGLGGKGSFLYGCDGSPTYAPSGEVQFGAHPDLFLSTPTLLVGGVSETMEVVGTPGTKVFLLTSNEPHWRVLPPAIGVLHLLAPLDVAVLGTLSGTGTLSVSYDFPAPPATNEFTSLQFQVFAVENGTRYLSNPIRSVVLHPDL